MFEDISNNEPVKKCRLTYEKYKENEEFTKK